MILKSADNLYAVDRYKTLPRILLAQIQGLKTFGIRISFLGTYFVLRSVYLRLSCTNLTVVGERKRKRESGFGIKFDEWAKGANLFI